MTTLLLLLLFCALCVHSLPPWDGRNSRRYNNPTVSEHFSINKFLQMFSMYFCKMLALHVTLKPLKNFCNK